MIYCLFCMQIRLMSWRGILAALLLAPIVAHATTTPGFERYEVIINRKPFGAPPPAPEPAKPPAPQAESFAKSLRLSMITETEDGEVRVGIIDNRNNSSYILTVGSEPQDGIVLVSASFADGEAILKQGEEMALLDINNQTFSEVPGDQQPARMQQAATGRASSYAERRRARQEQMEREANQPPPEPKYTGAELEKHLHEYQMEVIRQGLPPLPIPLTQAQDDQLVAEGYLPPSQ